MAAHYIGEIREVQPHGPYYIGGYSLGGEIAFEMAHQLVAAGEKVALLVLFDTSNPVRPVRPAVVPPAAGGDRARAGASGGRLPALRRKLRSHLRRLSGKSPKEKLLYLWKDARMRGRRLAVKAAVLYYRRRGLRLPEALRQQYLLESHVIAVMEYIPQVYPGRITLFRASQSLPGNPIDDPMGWGPLAAGGIDLHIFDSTHVIVSERFSKDVAAVLKACLAQARAEP
jgi:thioesterase domain-containing protein